MSLLYQINRGTKIDVPDSTRRLNNYHNLLPVENDFSYKKSFRQIISEKPLKPDISFLDQIRRGGIIPEDKGRIIDHDRSERLQTQEHGMKIRFSGDAKTDILRQTTDINKTMNQMKNLISTSINNASTSQIQAMANIIGIPITNNIKWLRNMISKKLKKMLAGEEVSSMKQNDIIELLTEIQENTGRQIQELATKIGIPITNNIIYLRNMISEKLNKMLAGEIESQYSRDEIIQLLKDLKVNTPQQIQPVDDSDEDEQKSDETLEEIYDEVIRKSTWEGKTPEEQKQLIAGLFHLAKTNGATIENENEEMTKRKFIIGANGNLISVGSVKKYMNRPDTNGAIVVRGKVFKITTV